MKGIAARAGVASQTVYFVFRNKVSILSAALDVTIAGQDEDVPVMDRSWAKRLPALTGANEAADLLAWEGGAIVGRTAPLFRVILRAATDPEVADLLTESKRQRGETFDLAADALRIAGLIRDEEHRRRFADVMYAVLSEECYLLLVEERGWSSVRWQTWVASQLHRQLTDDREFDDAGGDAPGAQLLRLRRLP